MARKSSVKNGAKLSVKRGDDKASKFGPKTSGNMGSKVGDGAGTREVAGFAPETKAILPEKYGLPAAAKGMAAKTMPVPGVNDGLINTFETWTFKRDHKGGK